MKCNEATNIAKQVDSLLLELDAGCSLMILMLLYCDIVCFLDDVEDALGLIVRLVVVIENISMYRKTHQRQFPLKKVLLLMEKLMRYTLCPPERFIAEKNKLRQQMKLPPVIPGASVLLYIGITAI